MKNLDFTPKDVINCVDNEPALWDTEFTGVHREHTARINKYHWLSFLEAQCYTHLLSVSVSDILFNPCGVFPFLRLGRYHCGT